MAERITLSDVCDELYNQQHKDTEELLSKVSDE